MDSHGSISIELPGLARNLQEDIVLGRMASEDDLRLFGDDSRPALRAVSHQCERKARAHLVIVDAEIRQSSLQTAAWQYETLSDPCACPDELSSETMQVRATDVAVLEIDLAMRRQILLRQR